MFQLISSIAGATADASGRMEKITELAGDASEKRFDVEIKRDFIENIEINKESVEINGD